MPFLLPACGEKVPKADEGPTESPASRHDMRSTIPPRTPHPASLREAVPLPAPRGEGVAWRDPMPFLLPAPRGEGVARSDAMPFLLPAGGEKVPKADEGPTG